MAASQARSWGFTAVLFTVSLLQVHTVELRTTARIARPSVSPRELAQFLATPSHWPQIVLSSVAVAGDDVDRPLRRGASVEEIFGAPPVLPLSVSWTCERFNETAGILDVRSADGLAGVANDCRMLFTIAEAANGNGACDVELRMSYSPISPLAQLATPVLAADNWLALNVLLPAALAKSGSGRSELAAGGARGAQLDEFRRLMGVLYGFAGVAHALDCSIGSSQLLTHAGIPAFAELTPTGQLVAVLWCLAGPAAFALSRAGGAAADAGLVAYGTTEVGAAVLASVALPAGPELGAAPLQAIGVQLVVLAAWLFSARRDGEQELR